MESKKYKLNKKDGKKILKGALITVCSVFLPAAVEIGTKLLNYLAEVVPQIDFGSYTVYAIIISNILINAGRKALAGRN